MHQSMIIPQLAQIYCSSVNFHILVIVQSQKEDKKANIRKSLVVRSQVDIVMLVFEHCLKRKMYPK